MQEQEYCKPCNQEMRQDGSVWYCPRCRAWRFANIETDDPYLTGAQVGVALGVSRTTVYRWVDKGRIPPPHQWRQSVIATIIETDDPYLTGAQVGTALGVSRKTVYRWADEGRIPPPDQWRRSAITALAGHIQRARKGPLRNPRSVRYTTGRHRYEKGLSE